MRKTLFVTSAILAACVSSANAFELGKPFTTSVLVTKPKVTNERKDVVVMRFNLTSKEQKTLLSYKPKKSLTVSKDLPPAVDLGMNDVPVLNQGMHGTCVTFATTAILDAVIGKGDYISQLCQLELGNFLEENSFMPSGWDGSWAPWVLDQMTRFGVISKENQTKRTCAGVTEYPTDDMFDSGNAMSLFEYKRLSEDISFNFYPITHMNFIQRFEDKFSNTDAVEKVLTNVKAALAKGHRLLLGTFLIISPYCSAGACATYKAKEDTWALSKDIDTPPVFTGGHEMVIVGYDDAATAVDAENVKHQGLLILRNSWGDNVGDQGNYYMSYDYFKKYAGDVIEISPISMYDSPAAKK